VLTSGWEHTLACESGADRFEGTALQGTCFHSAITRVCSYLGSLRNDVQSSSGKLHQFEVVGNIVFLDTRLIVSTLVRIYHNCSTLNQSVKQRKAQLKRSQKRNRSNNVIAIQNNFYTKVRKQTYIAHFHVFPLSFLKRKTSDF